LTDPKNSFGHAGADHVAALRRLGYFVEVAPLRFDSSMPARKAEISAPIAIVPLFFTRVGMASRSKRSCRHSAAAMST
jgi:hypothetical protein